MQKSVSITHKGQNLKLGTCLALVLNSPTSIYLKYDSSFPTADLSNTLDYTYKLQFLHSPLCPPKILKESFHLNIDMPKSIKLAASLIVISEDNHMLFIRKLQKMSLNPVVWAFSSATVKRGESAIKAAARALANDTGLVVIEDEGRFVCNGSEVRVEPVCGYESVFPHMLKQGMPRSQALVVFFVVKLVGRAEEIEVRNGENGCSVWLSVLEWKAVQRGDLLEIRGTNGKEFESSSFKGISPNSEGEGVLEGHFRAASLTFSLL